MDVFKLLEQAKAAAELAQLLGLEQTPEFMVNAMQGKLPDLSPKPLVTPIEVLSPKVEVLSPKVEVLSPKVEETPVEVLSPKVEETPIVDIGAKPLRAKVIPFEEPEEPQGFFAPIKDCSSIYKKPNFDDKGQIVTNRSTMLFPKKKFHPDYGSALFSPMEIAKILNVPKTEVLSLLEEAQLITLESFPSGSRRARPHPANPKAHITIKSSDKAFGYSSHAPHFTLDSIIQVRKMQTTQCKEDLGELQ